MDDPMGRSWLENQAAGSDSIEFSNWPRGNRYLNLYHAKGAWISLRRKYFRMMKLGDEVVKLLEEEHNVG